MDVGEQIDFPAPDKELVGEVLDHRGALSLSICHFGLPRTTVPAIGVLFRDAECCGQHGDCVRLDRLKGAKLHRTRHLILHTSTRPLWYRCCSTCARLGVVTMILVP